MREIKFRAWDANAKKLMRGSELVDVLMYGTQYGHGKRVKVLAGSTERPIALMQYTGLKDKNGVEIYEGDVIEVSADEYRMGRREDGEGDVETERNLHRFTVEWHQSDAAYKAIDVNDKRLYGELVRGVYLWLHAARNSSGEVIGNIYENPGMLEAKL